MGLKQQEIWKDIDGYDGLYQISNFGRVMSLPRNGTIKTYRILSNNSYNNGYQIITLSKNGKRKTHFVHRLVAQAFIPNPEKKLQINHKNEIKNDNRAENLEWCDSKYNINYGTRTEKSAKKHSRAICMFDKNGNYITTYESGIDAFKQTGISRYHINSCCRKKYGRKTAGGYVWVYESEVL